MAIIIRMYTARLLTTLDQRLCEKVFTAFNEYFYVHLGCETAALRSSSWPVVSFK